MSVILQYKGVAKRTLMIFASYVVANDIDLGNDPDFLQLANIVGVSEFLTIAIEDIKNLGYIKAIKKHFN